MEDGVKGSSDAPPGSQVPHKAHKAGWLKKSSGLLGLWKERYILISKSQLLVCESEDEQKCVETLELGSYERCQDQKAFLKRKRHFTLIPSPGTKVQEVKFLAKNSEERDSWIQALNEGITRGKNKIFDEVTVDNSCSLEHVTRDRPKMGAGKRRPPTRIHLKEVAEAAADGSSRLDLDKLESGVPRAVTPIPEDTEPQPLKEEVKIPMPPTKPSSTPSTENAHPNTMDSDTKTPRPPSPPAKILKESVYAREKLLSEGEEIKSEGEKGLKPTISGSRENLVENINTPPKPPPKILSDKMKIRWMEPSSDKPVIEKMKSPERGSKENLVEFDSDEAAKSTNPIPMVLSEDMKTPEHVQSTSSLEIEDHGGFEDPGEESTANNLEQLSIEDCLEMAEAETKEEQELKDCEKLKNETDEEGKSSGESNGKPSLEKDTPKVQCTLTPVISVSAKTSFPERIPRSSSMGDVLSESSTLCERKSEKRSSLLHLNKDHLYQVEMKLASGREKTETLLNRVLQGELVKSTGGNGPEVNAETLLNEAVMQLKEASQALQEIKESSKRSDGSETVAEKQKELVTMYRRSVP
ncbi:pleckstrin homology domain-containing family O member 2 [Rhinophrynus dorsalis]